MGNERYHISTTKGKWGFTVTEPGNPEWELAVFSTGRQDGKVSFAVILTEIDGLVRVQNGLVLRNEFESEVCASVQNLLSEASWQYKDTLEVIVRKGLSR